MSRGTWWDLAWFRRTYPAPVAPYPTPVVASRDGVLPTAVPAPVTKLVREAEAAGWQTMIQYAEGWAPHATTGRPGVRPKESFAVRMRREEQGACAVYVHGSTWSWESMFLWAPDRFWTRMRTMGDLTVELAAREP